MEFQWSYFKSWKMMLWKCCTQSVQFSSVTQLCPTLCDCMNRSMPGLRHSIGQQIWKTQQWAQDWKRSVFIPIPKKGNAKECANHHTVAFNSHASKVMLKILQVRLQQYVNDPDVQVGFRKGRGTRDQIANIHWIMEKAKEFQKKIYFCFIDYDKVFDCVHHNNCGKFWKWWE